MGNPFFFKGISLGGNFRDHVLEEQILLGRKLCQQNFLDNFLRVKKNTGKEKCFGGKIWGAKIFESNRTNLNTSVRKILDVSDEPFSTLV